MALSSNFQKMHQTYQFDSEMLKLSFFVLQEAVHKELNILLNRIFSANYLLGCSTGL